MNKKTKVSIFAREVEMKVSWVNVRTTILCTKLRMPIIWH